jgi:hypothetical protein
VKHASQYCDGYERQAVRSNEFAHRGDVHSPGQQLGPLRRINAVIAPVTCGGAGDAEMDFACAGIAHHLHDLHRGRAADNRVVDENDPLSFNQLAIGIVLALNAGVTCAIGGLDERPADIV